MIQNIGIKNYNILKNIKYKKVRVNDIEYDCIVGLNTGGGYYKNGFTTEEINGKEGKHKYLIFKFYTSVNHKIDIEEQWLIRDDGKVCKRIGWSNINLLSMCHDNKCLEDINCILNN